MKKTLCLYEKIAARMKHSLKNDPNYHLASLAELSLQWSVSRPTIRKSLRLLAGDQLVILRQGSLPSAGPRSACFAENPSGGSAGDRVYQMLRNKLTDGIYEIGKQIPKMSHLVAAEGLSYSTVCAAFARLAKDNLIHRRGRRWFAGAAPAPGAAPDSKRQILREPQVVLVLGHDSSDCYSRLEDTFISPFMNLFRKELMDHNTILEAALTHKPHREAYAVSSGFAEVKSRITSLGSRYKGTLVSMLALQEAQIHTWINALSRFRMPVVCFDSADGGSYLCKEKLLDALSKKVYYRLHLDEKAAISAALKELAGNGHRRIGIHGWEIAAWSIKRAELIEQISVGMDPAPHVFRCPYPAERWWDFGNLAANTSGAALSDIAWRGSPVAPGEKVPFDESFRRKIVRKAASLVRFLSEFRPTALIAINDAIAREYYILFRALCVQIPQDVSVVSFDNSPLAIYFPMSNIDFGFARLGYLASHIFLGDFQVRADRNRDIAGVCTLIDRGSVSMPRKSDGSLMAKRDLPKR
jgi:DNA-binding transcriptional regulator YhcF (GntR family)